MADKPKSIVDNPAFRRWSLFYLKAGAALAILWLAISNLATMPTWAAFAFWTLVIMAFWLSAVYPTIVNKELKHHTYVEGSFSSRRNSGRTIAFLVCLFAAIAAATGFLADASTWSTSQWIAVVIASLLFPIIYVAVQKWHTSQYEEPFRAARTLRRASIALAVVMLVILAVQTYFEPRQSYQYLAAAVGDVPNVFEGSDSTILVEAGRFMSFVDAGLNFALYQFTGLGYCIGKLLLSASAVTAVSAIIALCAAKGADLRRVFETLDVATQQGEGRKLLVGKVVFASVAPLVLFAGMLIADYAASEAVKTSEYSCIEKFIQDKAGVKGVEYDGVIYEYAPAKVVIDQYLADSAQLLSEHAEILTPLINEFYDARIANVDNYLDWYYTLGGDYERLVQSVTGGVEQLVQDKLDEQLGLNVDDSKLEEEMAAFNLANDDLKESVKVALEPYKLDGVPEWLIQIEDTLDLEVVYAKGASEELLGPGGRLGVGMAAGIGAGVASKILIAKLVEKAFFKTAVEKISLKLSQMGLSQLIGGVAGTPLAGPVGTAIGVVAGGAVGVAVDFALVKVDEAQNRESYKQEIIAAIEEQRTATLASLEPQA